MGKWKAHSKRLKTQRGQAIIELTAGLLIFIIMMALVISFSVYLYFQQALITAAREGARYASLNSRLGSASTQNAGMSAVQSYTSTQILSLTGQQATPSNATITVRPPSQSANQTVGERTVTVNIQWKMTNPVGISKLLDALGADGSAFKTIPVYATATMRYEE